MLNAMLLTGMVSFPRVIEIWLLCDLLRPEGAHRFDMCRTLSGHQCSQGNYADKQGNHTNVGWHINGCDPKEHASYRAPR